MKTCSACRDDKSLEQFNKNKALKDGLDNQCKLCARASKAKWKKANLGNTSMHNAKHYALNPCKGIERNKRWRIANPAKAAMLCGRRGKAIKERTPIWLTELHFDQMNVFYQTARLLTAELGLAFHVDHIEPLRGKNRSGLHVPWNLQVLPAKENLSKGAK